MNFTPSPYLSRRALLALTPVLAAPAILHFASTGQSSTAAWPDRTVHVVVPVPPGGSLDIIGRVLAQQLGNALGVSVVVDNMPGAGSNIAFEHVAKSHPDGNTLLVGSDVLAINPALYPQVGYDPVRDFTAVAEAVRAPQVLVVRNTLEVADARAFLKLAGEAPEKLTMASQGNGSLGHLAGVLLAKAAGVSWVHVPYRGGGPAVIDLTGGHIDALLVTLPAAIQQIRAGQIRALAVTSRTRDPALPDVPTIAETGYPGFEVVTWQGIVAPAGTPAPIVKRLSDEIVRALAVPEVRATLEKQAFQVTGTGPAPFGALLRDETTRWAEVVRASGARID